MASEIDIRDRKSCLIPLAENGIEVESLDGLEKHAVILKLFDRHVIMIERLEQLIARIKGEPSDCKERVGPGQGALSPFLKEMPELIIQATDRLSKDIGEIEEALF